MSSTSLDLSASTDLEWVTDLARPVLDAAKGAVARWPARCSQPLRRPVLSGAAMTFHGLQELNAPDNAGDSGCWCYEMSAYLYKCRHIEEHVLEGVRVRVFSPAKSVADCFKYRHKIGLDEAIEALR